MTIHFHRGDLPDGLDLGKRVAIDTETQGLSLVRDGLCLVQLSAGDGEAHIVQPDRANYDCPNLKALLADTGVEKLLHFARFDLAIIERDLGVTMTPVFCTKIASKLVRTFTDRHGLKYLLNELADVDVSKQQQTSDWGQPDLTDAQLEYAASDVLHLHKLKAALEERLKRENRMGLAQACFDFLPARAHLDLLGWGDEKDIFQH